MIFKFCYGNEIHRCSDPPVDSTLLYSFLNTMFRTPLPSLFKLTYTDSEGSTISILSDEQYQSLRGIQSSKPVKIVIVPLEPEADSKDPLPEANEYEIIQNKSLSDSREEPKEEKEEEEEKIPSVDATEKKIEPEDQLDKLLEKFTQEIAELQVIPQVQAQVENRSLEENDVKKIVTNTLAQQMPSIVAQVKEALLKEGLFDLPPKVDHPLPMHPLHQAPIQVQDLQEQLKELNRLVLDQQNVSELLEVKLERADRPRCRDNLFNRIKKAVQNLPRKVSDVAANITDKLDFDVGNPNVVCAEGTYRKNVVEMTTQLHELFPEVDRKILLDFVSQLPSDWNLGQVAEYYCHTQQQQQS